jgi:hypothetical protein
MCSGWIDTVIKCVRLRRFSSIWHTDRFAALLVASSGLRLHIMVVVMLAWPMSR